MKSLAVSAALFLLLLVGSALAEVAPINVYNTFLNSRIWSGYVLTTGMTGTPYSQVSATWQVPRVQWGPTSYNPYGWEYHTAWIGIAGVGDSSLIQMGTESIVNASGTQYNYVWYELYPAVSVNIPYAVGTGDTITSSITCTANCVPGQTQTWLLTMRDATRNWTYTHSYNFASSMAAAEWVLETPTYGAELPLNNYGKITFNGLTANGAAPVLDETNRITMTTPYGQTSNPSVFTGGRFSTCYGAGAFTPCSTP